MADGKVTIDVLLDDQGAVKGIKGLEGVLGGVTSASEKVTGGVMKIVSALGLMKIAGKAIDMIKDSMDSAIKRVDTLNRFPQMMEAMGFSAEDSEKSIGKLSEGIQGLPTTLDGVAATAQQIAILTGDLEGATDTTLALNNAFLASGSDSADASRGLQQYTQMLSKGEVDMQSWRTLQETMGVALNDTAKAFGFAGASAQNDLYDALKDGTITFDEFNDKIIELDGGVGGFAERALIASKGIKTSMQNIKTAIATGLANSIQTVDEVMQAGGFGSIADNLDKVKAKVQEGFKGINKAIETGLPVLLTFAGDVRDLISIGFQEGIVEAGKAAHDLMFHYLDVLWNSVEPGFMQDLIGIIFKIGSGEIGIAKEQAWRLLNNFLDALHERLEGFLEIGSNIITKMVEGMISSYPLVLEAMYRVYNTIVMILMESIPLILDVGTNIMNALFTGIQEMIPRAGEIMQEALNQMVTTIMINLPVILESGVNFLLSLIQGIKDTLPILATTAMETVTSFLNVLMENLPAILEMGVNALWALVDGIIEALPAVGQVALDIVKWLIDTLVENLPGIIAMGMDLLVNLVNGIAERLPMVVQIASDIIKDFIAYLISKLPDIISVGVDIILSLIDGFLDTVGNVGSAMREIGDTIKETIKSVNLFDIGVNIVKGLWNGIGSVKDWILGKISGFTDSIVSGIKGFFGVASPSKRLRDEVGKFLPQGLAVGIEANADDAINSMKGLAGKVMGVATSEINLPDVSRIAMPNMNRPISYAGAGVSNNTKTITNNSKPTIIIEKIENYSDSDIPRILEESAWEMQRGMSKLDG